MARRLYSLVVFCLLPWALLHLLWRARRQPEYLRHWGERFGHFGKSSDPRPVIWLHAVSVGETRAAQPLIAALRVRYPDHRILFTHMTPTGRATSVELFGDTVERVFLPYDTPWAVERFLRHFQPRLGLIMETELWPNLIAACAAADIPLLLVNARLSQRSAKRYAGLATLSRGALRGLGGIGAQAQADAERLRELGADAVTVTGNMKFDVAPPPQQLAQGEAFRSGFGRRPVWLAASTREGEEALILDAWRAHADEALLVLVPRHPQRFDAVAQLAAERGYTVQRRSVGIEVAAGTQVLLGDSMGEMFAWYASVDVAFVGGSLLDYGCQNLIEPCAIGTPVLIGPSIRNFAEAATEATRCGAALSVTTAEQLVEHVRELLAHPERRQTMSAAGREFAAHHRGATAKTLDLISRAMR